MGTAKGVDSRADQTLGVVAVHADLPPCSTTQTKALDVLGLDRGNRGGVVGDHVLAGGVVAVAGADGGQLDDTSVEAGHGESLVVPDTGGAEAAQGADVGELGTGASGQVEGAAVEGRLQQDLVGGGAGRDVVQDAGVGLEVGRLGVGHVGEEVGLVSGVVAEATLVVEGHEAVEVDVGGHVGEVEQLVLVGSGGRRVGDDEGGRGVQLLLESVEASAQILEQTDHLGGLFGTVDVFVIDIETVKAEVGHQLHCGGHELAPLGLGGQHGAKVHPVGPSTNGENSLEVAVGLLEEVQLLDVSIDVGAGGGVIVAGVGILQVGPLIAQDTGMESALCTFCEYATV